MDGEGGRAHTLVTGLLTHAHSGAGGAARQRGRWQRQSRVDRRCVSTLATAPIQSEK